MLDSGYFGQLITGIFYLVVGTALLRLSRRSGERPEFHLGFYFLLTGVDYFTYSAAAVFKLDSIMVQCAFIARVAYAIAVVHLVIFIRGVFRPREAWATWLAVVFSLGLSVPIAALAVLGDWTDVQLDNPWYWPNFLGYLGALSWLTFEALHAHSGARKRLRIGLCSRTVVNRYLLWACFGAFQVLACGAIIVMALDTRGDNIVSGWSDSLLSATELASIAMLLLAFFPPAAYLRWIAGSGSSAISQTRDTA